MRSRTGGRALVLHPAESSQVRARVEGVPTATPLAIGQRVLCTPPQSSPRTSSPCRAHLLFTQDPRPKRGLQSAGVVAPAPVVLGSFRRHGAAEVKFCCGPAPLGLPFPRGASLPTRPAPMQSASHPRSGVRGANQGKPPVLIGPNEP